MPHPWNTVGKYTAQVTQVLPQDFHILLKTRIRSWRPPRQDLAALWALKAKRLWLGQSWHGLKGGEGSSWEAESELWGHHATSVIEKEEGEKTSFFFCLGTFSLSAECNWNELVCLSVTLNGTAFLQSQRWGSLTATTALLGSWEVVRRALTQLRAFSWELLLCIWLHLSGWDWCAWKGACPPKCCFKWKANLFLS